MSKYKLLVNRENKSFYDFIRNTSKYYNAVTTLCNMTDMKNHLDILKPDAFVLFLVAEENGFVENVSSLHEEPEYNSIPVIIVGNGPACDKMTRKYPSLASLYIRLPASVDNLALKINRYLEEIAENAQKAPIAITEVADNSARKRILAVDDDRNVLKILKAALSDKYDVTTMANGALVGKFLESNDVNMILLDHEMPGESGAEVFEKLKNHPKGKNIPVCFLTGISVRTEIEKIMRLRPHGYLLKPINVEMLLATIQNLIL